MKYKLPILAVIFCLLGAISSANKEQPQAEESSTTVEADQRSASTDDSIAEGQQLLVSAAQATYQHASISAKIRQRINLFGRELVGSGSYLQIGTNSDKLFRLELKIPVAGEVSSHLQVCDGKFLWIRTDLLNEVSLNRVDLRRVREHLQENPHHTRHLLSSGWLTLGGLPNLLTSLEYFFQFSLPVESQLSDISTWKIHGRWKPEELAKILPEQKDLLLSGNPPRPGSIPEQLPESVIIVLGQDDLFPYQITFMREANAKDSATDSSNPVPFLTLEFFEVRTKMDPLNVYFIYKPKEEVTDITEKYLQIIRSKAERPSR